MRDLIRKAKINWKKGPRIDKIEKEWADYYIGDDIQDIEDCIYSDNPAYLIFSGALNEFIYYYFRLGNIWFPRPKDRLVELKKRAPRLYKLVKEINMATDWKLKAKKTIEVGRLIGAKYNLKLTGEINITPNKWQK